MKKMLAMLSFLIALCGLMILFSGCYTQLSTTRDEREESYSHRQKNDDDSTYADNNDDADRDGQSYTYNNDDWTYGQRVGFSYYYPSYSTFWPSSYFRTTYTNLLSPGGYGYAWYYDPHYCDPWWSYTSLAYDPYYYTPVYYTNPSYYYGSGSGYSSTNYKPQARGFGANRGNDVGARPLPTGTGGYNNPSIDRGSSGVGGTMNLPTGVSIGGAPSRGAAKAPEANTVPRTNGTQRISTGSTNGNRNSAGSNRGVRGYGSPAHGGSPRDAQPTIQTTDEGTLQTPPAHSTVPAKNNNGQQKQPHGTRGTDSSHGNSPRSDSHRDTPPATQPAPSNPPPPPSGNNSAPRSGSSRGIRP